MGWIAGMRSRDMVPPEDIGNYYGNAPCIPPQVLAPMIDRIYLRAEAQAALADEMNPSKP